MFHIVHTLDFPPSLDVAIMKLEPGQTSDGWWRFACGDVSVHHAFTKGVMDLG